MSKEAMLESDGLLVVKRHEKNTKDGTIFEVGKGRRSLIAKVFRSNKNKESIEREYKFLKAASKASLSPKVAGCNLEHRYFLMEKMDGTLYEWLKDHDYTMSLPLQKRLIAIMKELDRMNILHADTSPLNFMFKGGQMFVIDFGEAVEMTDEDERTNTTYGLMYFVLKTRKVCSKFHPELIMKKISTYYK
jgi:predicted Ser/Thr protein kinase